jgi:capsid protein
MATAWKPLNKPKTTSRSKARIPHKRRVKNVGKTAEIRSIRKVTHVLSPLVSTASEFHTRIHEINSVRKQMLTARRGSYRAALNPRSRLQTPYGGSGDQHVDVWSRRMLRELSRDMDRNADTFGVLNDAFAAATVGEGVKYRPTTKDTEWNKIVARKMDEKMRKDRGGIDCREIRTGYRIQYDLVRAFAVDGETAFLKLNNKTIQCFESEQITNGGVYEERNVDGVESNENGSIKGYHIVPYDMMGRLAYSAGEDYDANHVEWLANRSRFSQTRGVPLIVGGIDDWERLDSFRESEIIAAEQGSQIYGVIKHPEGSMGTSRPFAPGSGDPSQVVRGGITDGSNGGGLAVDWQPTVAGALLDLPDGKDYVPVNPSRPNPEAVPFMMELIRQFCAKAGLPYEFVYNDVRGLSWSVNRALVQMARDRISIWQKQFFAPMFSNLYLWILGNMIDSGEIPANEEWQSHELQWSQISWPDEGAEYVAQSMGLLKGLTSRHRVHGPLWRDILEERAVELEFASDLAMKHNSRFKDFPITPQFFLGFEGEITQSKTETDSTSETKNLDANGKTIKKEGAK